MPKLNSYLKCQGITRYEEYKRNVQGDVQWGRNEDDWNSKIDFEEHYYWNPKLGLVCWEYEPATNCCGVDSVGYVHIYPNNKTISNNDLIKLCKAATKVLRKEITSGYLVGFDVVHKTKAFNPQDLSNCDTRLFFELGEWDTDGKIVQNKNSNNWIQMWSVKRTGKTFKNRNYYGK